MRYDTHFYKKFIDQKVYINFLKFQKVSVYEIIHHKKVLKKVFKKGHILIGSHKKTACRLFSAKLQARREWEMCWAWALVLMSVLEVPCILVSCLFSFLICLVCPVTIYTTELHLSTKSELLFVKLL